MKIALQIEEASLKNLNLSSEGHEENPTSRIDLNFEGLASADVLNTLTGSDKASAFWNEKGDLELMGIKNMDSSAEIPDCNVSFHGVGLKQCKVKKFRIHPHNGKVVGLSLQVQVHHTPEELVQLDKLQKKVGTLKIDSTGEINIAGTVPDNQQGLDLET